MKNNEWLPTIISGATSILVAIIALGGVIWSNYNAKKNLEKQLEIQKNRNKQDLISQSRLNWIKEVRSVYANLLLNVENIKPINSSKDRKNNTRKEMWETSEFRRNLSVMKLYFAEDDSENSKVVNKLEKLSKELKVLINLIQENDFEKNKEELHKIKEKITKTEESLTKLLTKYFKEEWKRIKSDV